jgi:subtilisin-like proprotein convertase family protein
MKRSKLLLMVLCMLTIQLSAQQKNPEKEKEAAQLATEPSTISLEKLITNKSDSYVITKEHVSSISGIRHVYLRQAINGIEVYGTESGVHFDKTGKVLVEHNKFLADVQATLKKSSQSIDARAAITSVANQMGYKMSNLQETKSIGGKNKAAVFNKAGISSEDIPVKLMYYYREGFGTQLVWELSIAEKTSSDWWNFRVDASTGKIIDKDNWTISCNILGDHESHEHAEKDTVPFVGPMEKPVSNTTSNMSNLAPPPAASYNVYAMPVESPFFGSRSVVSNPENLTASPYGWHDTNGADGAEFTNTRGNNADAYDDDDNNNLPDNKYAVSPGGNLIFDFPLNTTYSAGDQSQSAAITNLFYWSNIIHDVMYQYGFDEASGNFQQNNYGKGGLGNDPVNAEAQDGSGTCNANFSTPGDGNRPRMQMYVCSNKDGDLDNWVIIHEYGHGISNRLNSLSGQEQMGEGWSDFYGLLLTMVDGTTRETPRGFGSYAFFSIFGMNGARTQPYSTDFAINNYTYDSIKTEVAPHGVGSVWAEMLWEMTWELIDLHGFSTDFYNGNGGNNVALALVTEGLKLQPASSGFVDGRDAILLADQAIYGGANQCAIWNAFARRGLGYSAIQGSSASKTDGTEAFDLPPTFSGLDVIDEVCLSDGIQLGLSGGNPAGGFYDGPGVTDDGNGSTFTFDPSIGGPGLVSVTYLVNDFCTGASTTLTDDINVTNNPPEIICVGSGTIPMTGSQSSSPGIAIPDGVIAGVTVTMNVTEDVTITDLDVSLNIAQTWVGDLIVTVKSPAGTMATIVDRPGVPTSSFGCNGDNIVATLDDEAATPVESECAGSAPTINGSFIPNNPLSIFDGESTLGIWELTVSDVLAPDPGTLNSWGIDYDYEVTAPVLDVTLDGSGNATVNAEDLLFNVSVDCGGYTVLAGSPLAATVSFTCSDTGLNTVAVEVTNESGAVSTCSAIVNVIGSGGGGGPFVCPGDITQDNDLGICGAVVTYTVASSSGCGGSGPLATAIATLELISSAGGTGNRSGVSYNPSADRYYSVNAGSGAYPIDCFDGTSGALVNNIASGLSYRGAWWNPSLSQSEGNGISTTGVVLTNLSGDCPSGTTTPILPDNQPNTQSCGDLDYDNNEIIYYNSGSITQVDRATGTTNGTLALSGMPGGASYASNSVGYTGVVGHEYAIYDNTTQSVHLYGRATGAYATASSIGLTTTDFGFAYENGQAWIYINNRWNGFTIFGAASGTITQTAGLASGETFPVGTTTNTFEYDDGVNPVQTCSFDVTINDTEVPVANCAAPFTIQLDANGDASITAADIENGSTDVCGIASTSIDKTDFTCADVGPNTVTLTVTDVNGNVSTCTTIVTVEDNVPPVANCAAPFTIQLDDNGDASITVADIENGSTDACGIATILIDITDFTCADVGPNNVTLTVTDVNGNTSTCVAVVTVEDDLPPTIACPSDITVNTGAGLCSAIVTFPMPLVLDNCTATATQTGGLTSGSDFPVGVNTVEFTATDGSGNTAVCSFTITVVDNEPPTMVCQNITIQLDASGNASITAADVDGGSTDNCGIASILVSPSTFDCSDVGDNPVVLTVTDIHGNSNICIAIVTVEDVTSPVAVCQNITVELDPITGTVTIIGADVDGGSTDACGIDSYDLDVDTFDCSNIGDNTVVLTVIDVNGNMSSCTAIVTVEDNTNPELVCQDFTLELGADGTATLDPNDVIASNTDNCGIATVAVDITEFSCADIGTPVIVQVFTSDVNGNLSTCTAVVTVEDLLAPVVMCPADQTVDPGQGNLFYIVPDYFGTGEATAVDNCTAPVTITSQDPAAGTPIPDGVYTITLTAEDEYGNVSTCFFELTVNTTLGAGDHNTDIGTIQMYPNPVKNTVTIGNPASLSLEKLSIFDLRGRLVKTIDLRSMGTQKAIDVSEMAAATYLVIIQGENGQITKRLIKE